MGQTAVGAGVIHRLGQFLGQNLAQMVDRDVVAGSQLADDIAAENAAELVGRDRQVLAFAEPGFDLVTEPRLLELCDDRAETALIVAAEHLAQRVGQHGCAELAERATERRVVLQRV
jgi:hypothetical protein